MRMKKLLLLWLFSAASLVAFPQSTIVKYLSGTDKDHTVQWDFYCTGGRNRDKWTKIAVPSNWELQGFGNYNYGHDKVKADETGIYRCRFRTEGGWRHHRVFLVFEGSMTDTKVTINGKSAGPVHQGGFYRFKYDITSLLDPAGNTMEVAVSKMSANVSVNKAERNGDFWLFGGIYRPVYLEIVPETFIDRVAIDARADGSFQLDVYPQNMQDGETVSAQVEKLNGEPLGRPLSQLGAFGQEKLSLTGHFDNPLLWSPEFPYLYQVSVSIKDKKGLLHQIKKRFGFRTVELRTHDGLYVNNVKIKLKGCDRHSFWPETGRTLSHGIDLMDVRLMKDMNMNAVRMSHYPPDQDFLDLCDSLGLYVLDELTGWQAAYDTTVGHKLVKELVLRDVNHPSVIFWDNGNEGGWNRALDEDFTWYDPQQRIVLHPFERIHGTNTKHYPDYNYIVRSVANEQDVFFPTEFMHALYDGGGGAALDDFWNLMMQHPHGAGGFIWAFLDESVIRTDKHNIYDGDGNHAPDGLLLYGKRNMVAGIHRYPLARLLPFRKRLRHKNRSGEPLFLHQPPPMQIQMVACQAPFAKR
jgi:beta-galactosidase/beta-glucuronidase